MDLKIVSKENLKFYEEFVPPELAFLLYMDGYQVLGLIDNSEEKALAAGVCVLSFYIPDAVMMEWLFIDEEYRGHEYSSAFFEAARKIAAADGRYHVMAKLWGKVYPDTVNFLYDLGFTPMTTEITDTVFQLANLISLDALAKYGTGAHKAGFELKEVCPGVYVPMIFGDPEPEALRKSIAAALVNAAGSEKSFDAVLYLRCAPGEPLDVIKEFFMKGNRIGSTCYEASIDTPEYMTGVLEEQSRDGEAMRQEMDSIPTEFTMIGLAEY